MSAPEPPRPAARLSGLTAYRPSRAGGPGAARMHANEGRAPPVTLGPALEAVDPALYPDAGPLEARLAASFGVAPEQVMVTAGADDALARIALALLEPGRSAALLEPTFEMIPRYVQIAGGAPRPVPWMGGAFPLEPFLEALDGASVGFLVTPSSPAGQVIPLDALHRAADRARASGGLLVVDLAYVEFAEVDPTEALLSRGDVVVTRTFSKALGLAGLRVGYVMGPRAVVEWLRAVGQPFAVGSLSLAAASAVVDERRAIAERARARVRAERARIGQVLASSGAEVLPSEANFVLARWPEALAKVGFRVRAFGAGALDGYLRISCPQDEAVLDRFLDAARRIAQDPDQGAIDR